MKGRMIHHASGQEESQLYDPIRGQCINSISRPVLNQRLLEALPEGIDVRFETKVSRIDFRSRTAWGAGTGKRGQVQPGQENEDGQVGGGEKGEHARGKNQRAEKDTVDAEGTRFDLVIGCDGSWSKVRSEMMRVERCVLGSTRWAVWLTSRIDFSQSFIPHAYIELHMPADATKSGGFAMDKNHLHIWPRHAFMLIGLPNKVRNKGDAEGRR
jgi:kynurenine 3-monooxygenase